MNNTDARCEQACPHNFDRIAHPLKNFSQFVLWKREIRDDKPTKVPYSISNKTASVIDPSTWASFDSAVSAYAVGGFSGIGFVLTANDPFVFVDIDYADGDEAIIDRQKRLFAECPSYTELSPSGAGYHIIAEGSIPAGRKRHKIEIYNVSRFMTMTGNVVRDLPITNQDGVLNAFWHELGRSDRSDELRPDRAQSASDNAIIDRLKIGQNGNGALADDLWHGRWRPHYHTASEADFALIDVITFYTKNRAQAVRVFGYSALGKRDKYLKRPNLVAHMVNRGFDRDVPAGDHSQLIRDIHAKLGITS